MADNAGLDAIVIILPDGVTLNSSPTCTLPENTVPVTTVPAPLSVKLRSTASRKPSACDREAA